MIAIYKKIRKLNVAVNVFEEELAIENKLLQQSLKKHNELSDTKLMIEQRITEVGNSPVGVASGQAFKSIFDYKNKLNEGLKQITQMLTTLEMEIKAKREKVRTLVAKKTAALKLIENNKKEISNAEEKSMQQVSEIMHTVKSFNKDQ